jgi:HK97 family phage portal protein
VLRRKANDIQTAAGWLETAMVHLLLRGNHYSLIVRVNGNVRELVPLNPDLVEPLYRNGQLTYTVRPNPQRGESGDPAVLTRDRILHIVGKSSDGISGRSVIQDAVDVMGTSAALDEHTARIFRNGTHIGGVFEHPGRLGEEEHKRLLEQIKERWSGSSNAGKWYVAESGMTVKTLGMTNDDAQLIDTHKFQIAQIARFFGVPLHKLLDNVSQPRANMEQMSTEWVQDGLRPWATRIEQTVDDQLLDGDDELFSQFLFEDLLRGDLAARTAHYVAMFKIGAYSLDQIMAKENMNPIGGDIGHRRFRDIQLVPLESDGTAAVSAPAPGVN